MMPLKYTHQLLTKDKTITLLLLSGFTGLQDVLNKQWYHRMRRGVTGKERSQNKGGLNSQTEAARIVHQTYSNKPLHGIP